MATAVRNQARQQAARAERERCKAIIQCPEAKGRDKLAVSLACGTELTVEQARAVLARSPRTSKLLGL